MAQRKWIASIFSAGLLTAIASASAAAKNPIPGADALIKLCSVNSQKGYESGVNSKMLKAAYQNIECLQKEIEKQSAILLEPNGAMTVRKLMQHLQGPMSDLYRTIYFDRKSCRPFLCGSSHTVMAQGNVTAFYESLLRTVIASRSLDK